MFIVWFGLRMVTIRVNFWAVHVNWRSPEFKIILFNYKKIITKYLPEENVLKKILNVIFIQNKSIASQI